MGQTYDRVVDYLDGDDEELQRNRFAQIRSANENIQNLLQQRMIYVSGHGQMSMSHAPSTQLEVKNFPFSLHKQTLKISDNFKCLSFDCDVLPLIEKDKSVECRYLIEVQVVSKVDN